MPLEIARNTDSLLTFTVTDTTGVVVTAATCTATIYNPLGTAVRTAEPVPYVSGKYTLLISKAWLEVVGETLRGQYRIVILAVYAGVQAAHYHYFEVR